jgi:hypothetical protein
LSVGFDEFEEARLAVSLFDDVFFGEQHLDCSSYPAVVAFDAALYFVHAWWFVCGPLFKVLADSFHKVGWHDSAVGGCFCEALSDGSLFEHGRVTAVDDDRLALNAPLGPLKGRATRADLTFSWPEGPSISGEVTGVVMSFVVEGPGLGAFADAVDGVMAGQHARLLNLIADGSPAQADAD